MEAVLGCVLSTPSYPLLLVALLLLLGVLVLSYTQSYDSCLPPGPAPLPLIGNIHLLLGRSHRALFQELGRRYGDVYTFYLGRKRVVVLNSYDAIKEAFVNYGDVFSGRPSMVYTVVYPRNSGILLSDGDVWKNHRRFTLRHLKDLGFGKRSFEKTIASEIEHFLQAIKEYNGRPFDISSLIINSVSNLICSLTFNKRFDHDDEEFRRLTEAIANNAGGNALFYQFIVQLRFIPWIGNAVKRRVEGVQFVKSFCERQVKEHASQFNPDVVNDLIDAYLKGKMSDDGKIRTDSETNIFNDVQITKVVHDMFGAGTETTSTVLRWALLFMMKHEDVQTRVRSEIMNIVGTGRRPSMDDKPNLHYTQAVIAEVLRLGNIVPEGGPHRSVKDTEFRGYQIPADTVIIPNLTAVHFNENVFSDPHDFRPQRFLDANGQFDRSVADKTIPFSIGRRVCLGESLARTEIFLFFTSMLQEFVFTSYGVLPEKKVQKIESLINIPPVFKLHASRVTSDASL